MRPTPPSPPLDGEPVAAVPAPEDAELDALVDAVASDARPGDHLLVMSNGGFGGIHAKLLARLSAGPAR